MPLGGLIYQQNTKLPQLKTILQPSNCQEIYFISLKKRKSQPGNTQTKKPISTLTMLNELQQKTTILYLCAGELDSTRNNLAITPERKSHIRKQLKQTTQLSFMKLHWK